MSLTVSTTSRSSRMWACQLCCRAQRRHDMPTSKCPGCGVALQPNLSFAIERTVAVAARKREALLRRNVVREIRRATKMAKVILYQQYYCAVAPKRVLTWQAQFFTSQGISCCVLPKDPCFFGCVVP